MKIIISLLLVLLLFTGCSKKTNNTSISSDADSIEIETTTSAATSTTPITETTTFATTITAPKSETTTSTSKNVRVETNIATDKKVIEDQNKALEKYQKLMHTFYDTETDTEVYPENYGGAFYGNGCLNINITDDNKERYINVIGNDNVKFYKVKFSFSQLKIVLNFIVDKMSDTSNGIIACGIDEEENYVEIDMFSEEQIKAVEDEINTQFPQIECYRFKIRDDYPTPCLIQYD